MKIFVLALVVLLVGAPRQNFAQYETWPSHKAVALAVTAKEQGRQRQLTEMVGTIEQQVLLVLGVLPSDSNRTRYSADITNPGDFETYWLERVRFQQDMYLDALNTEVARLMYHEANDGYRRLYTLMSWQIYRILADRKSRREFLLSHDEITIRQRHLRRGYVVFVVEHDSSSHNMTVYANRERLPYPDYRQFVTLYRLCFGATD